MKLEKRVVEGKGHFRGQSRNRLIRKFQEGIIIDSNVNRTSFRWAWHWSRNDIVMTASIGGGGTTSVIWSENLVIV